MKLRNLQFRKVTSVICLTFLLTSLFSVVVTPPHVLGDGIPVELVSSTMGSGSGFVISADKNITFGNSVVLIDITCTKSLYGILNYTTHLVANFTVQNRGETKKIMFGFVYPKTWCTNLGGYWTQEDVLGYSVFVNETKVNYSIVEGTSLDNESLFNVSNGDLDFIKTVHQSKIAVFNGTMQTNTTEILSLQTSFTIFTTHKIYNFEYIVATARAWNGNFTEVINITATHPNTVFVSPYYPRNATYLYQNNTLTKVSWEINKTNIEAYYTVGLHFWHSERNPNEIMVPVTFIILIVLGTLGLHVISKLLEEKRIAE